MNMVKLVCLLASILISTKVVANGQDESKSSSEVDDSYDCQFSIWKLPSSHIQLNMYHLVRKEESFYSDRKSNETEQRVKFDSSDVLIEKLSHNASIEELESSSVDPELPFTIFINGFNHNGALNESWMLKVGSVFTGYDSSQAKNKLSRQANVIFLSWHITGVFSDTFFGLIPAYLTTMANYQLVLDYFEVALLSLIDFVELKQRWKSKEARARYYSKFRFYAHSLGSHIIANTLDRVHKRGLNEEIKFGRVIGLDPALPCFVNDIYGLSASRASNSTNLIAIIHSNAGLAGAYSNRGHLEIILNGGTFQPNCSKFDFRCHHRRSTDIFCYMDDECSMVAYRCHNYEQFKLGACGTCEQEADSQLGGTLTPDCVLVNLAEQHIDASEIVFLSKSNTKTRQLDYEDSKLELKRNKTVCRNPEPDPRTRRDEYHFVNTNAKFASGLRTHCLQHYQLRLLVLNGKDPNSNKCQLNSFIDDDSQGIRFQLYYEQEANLRLDDGKQVLIGQLVSPIVDDKLYTGLLNFEGRPELFVGAIIENLDLRKLKRCLKDQEVEETISFVLDVAFMSHTKRKHAFSSVLCADWTTDNYNMELILNLCKQSQLSQISDQVDELLKQVQFNNKLNPWHVNLLNSLFSLYAEWDPF